MDNKNFSIEDKICKEYENGNIVFNTIDSLQVANIDNFINQPADGILYDLNRTEEVVRTFIKKDPKWVNDYAVAKVIRALKNKIDLLEKGK